MKNKLLFGSLVVAILVGGFRLTNAQSFSNSLQKIIDELARRVTALEERVVALQEELRHIQLIPGPQGPAGPTGPQGEPGESNWDEDRIAALETRVAALENPSATNCLSVLCENFNSYANGQIIGQDNWIDRENGLAWNVQDSVVEEGAGALSNFNSTGESVVTKNTGEAFADGQQSFYVRTENRAGWTNFWSENVQLGMFQDSWDGPARVVVAFTKDGHVSYVDGQSDMRINFGTYTDNTWNLVDVEWRSADKTARYRLNGGPWTNWAPFIGGVSFTGFDTVGLDGAYLGTGGVYVDNLH